MPEFWEKLKEGLNRRLAGLSAKGQELVAVTRLRAEIEALRKQREQLLRDLGGIACRMVEEEEISRDSPLGERCADLWAIQEKIAELERQIQQARQDAWQAGRLRRGEPAPATEPEGSTAPGQDSASTPPSAGRCECGATTPPGARFCPDCGRPSLIAQAGLEETLGEPRICATCGATLPLGADYCPECGSHVDEEEYELDD